MAKVKKQKWHKWVNLGAVLGAGRWRRCPCVKVSFSLWRFWVRPCKLQGITNSSFFSLLFSGKVRQIQGKPRELGWAKSRKIGWVSRVATHTYEAAKKIFKCPGKCGKKNGWRMFLALIIFAKNSYKENYSVFDFVHNYFGGKSHFPWHCTTSNESWNCWEEHYPP